MKWKEVKEFLDSCTEEQLNIEAFIYYDEMPASPIQSMEIIEEDLYIDGDDMDNEQILQTKEEWNKTNPEIPNESLKVYLKAGSIWAE